MFNCVSPQLCIFKISIVFVCLYLLDLVSELCLLHQMIWVPLQACACRGTSISVTIWLPSAGVTYLIGEFGVEPAPPLGSQPAHREHAFWPTTLGHTFCKTSSMWRACANSVLPVAEGVGHLRVSSERFMLVTHLSYILQYSIC